MAQSLICRAVGVRHSDNSILRIIAVARHDVQRIGFGDAIAIGIVTVARGSQRYEGAVRVVTDLCESQVAEQIILIGRHRPGGVGAGDQPCVPVVAVGHHQTKKIRGRDEQPAIVVKIRHHRAIRIGAGQHVAIAVVGERVRRNASLDALEQQPVGAPAVGVSGQPGQDLVGFVVEIVERERVDTAESVRSCDNVPASVIDNGVCSSQSVHDLLNLVRQIMDVSRRVPVGVDGGDELARCRHNCFE